MDNWHLDIEPGATRIKAVAIDETQDYQPI